VSEQYNEHGITFPAWYAIVDSVVLEIAGLGIEDLADGNSYDAWSDGGDPRDYAIERLAEDGFPFDLVGEI